MRHTFEIMHKDRVTAILTDTGSCEIVDSPFLPYGLYLEETVSDTDLMVNNLLNFYAWCAGRVLTLDRRYAKEILNSIGAPQIKTDRDRARVALGYHCLTLTDVWWVREKPDTSSFGEINLYENHLSNAFVDISLRGRQMSVTNLELAPDLSTSGCFPKAWVRKSDGFWLYKDGEPSAVENELLASQIARCFDLSQVLYQPEYYDGQRVSASRIFTGLDYSICTWEQFTLYAINHDIDPEQYVLALDPVSYYRMNIVDYLIGNTDRHWGNWGFLIDNATNQPVGLHPLMDLNQAFHSYDTLDGANCLTSFRKHQTQKEVALEATREAGTGLLASVGPELFGNRGDLYTMFMQRLDTLS